MNQKSRDLAENKGLLEPNQGSSVEQILTNRAIFDVNREFTKIRDSRGTTKIITPAPQIAQRHFETESARLSVRRAAFKEGRVRLIDRHACLEDARY